MRRRNGIRRGSAHMPKLVIQIPCFNEAETLPIVLADLPRTVPGIDCIEVVVIDDGSTDDTASVARACGAHHVESFPRHLGLARAFMAGLELALQRGGDIIVNTDADHQYRGEDIPRLVAPILGGQAELVIGTRPIESMGFSPVKRYLQRLGSRVTRFVSNTSVEDAPSGFRAFSREAALRLHVFNKHTYTLETIIQAGQIGMAVATVPIGANPELRPSRLVKGLASYVSQQVLVMLRVFVIYRPFRFFAFWGGLLFTLGFLIGLRFLYHFVTSGAGGHVQSLILAALLMGMGMALGVVGLLADLLAVNRALLEGVDWRLKKLEEHITRLGRGESGSP
jgi:glycosyltransferase involved in cell wall biosynthesis